MFPCCSHKPDSAPEPDDAVAWGLQQILGISGSLWIDIENLRLSVAVFPPVLRRKRRHHLFPSRSLTRERQIVAVTVGGPSWLSGITAAARSLARAVWSWARRARASLSWPRISSIFSCSCSSSPSLGGSVEWGGEDGSGCRGAGPPFSHALDTWLPPGTDPAPAPDADPEAPWPPSAITRARRRRVFSVSRLKWTLLLSLSSLAARLLSLFHLAKDPGGGGGGGCTGWDFWILQLYRI